jgi:hypothetical protein
MCRDCNAWYLALLLWACGEQYVVGECVTEEVCPPHCSQEVKREQWARVPIPPSRAHPQ